jgi:septum formation protein
VRDFILASGSQTRAKILRQAGIAFSVFPADVDETKIKTAMAEQDHADTAGLLADEKALCVSRQFPQALVVGCDQLLVFADLAVSKSRNLAEAQALLESLSGNQHRLLTAATLAKDGKVVWRTLNISTLWMRSFSREFLADYLQAQGEDILSSVGCYRLEESGVQLFEKIEGDYFSILGLPLLPLLAALRAEGAIAT